MKKCSKCEVEKDENCFRPQRTVCRDCINSSRREERASKKPQEQQPINPNNKICKNCKKELPSSEFRDYTTSGGNLSKRTECHDCEKKMGREYRQSEVGKSKAKAWMDKNKNDLAYKLRRNLGSRINFIFKQDDDFAITLLNCNIDKFIDWLRSCYTEGMTDENYGTFWEVDHVIPISQFNLSKPSNVKLCFSWFNIMPLKKYDNRTKRNYIDIEQLEKHVDNLFNCGDYSDLEEYFNLCATHLDAGNP